MVRKDFNLKIFLEYEEELAVRGKNVKEKISEFFGIVQVCQQSHNIIHYGTYMAGQLKLAEMHQPPNILLQRSGGELLLENTQHDGDAFFEAEKVTLTATFGKISRLLRSQLF